MAIVGRGTVYQNESLYIRYESHFQAYDKRDEQYVWRVYDINDNPIAVIENERELVRFIDAVDSIIASPSAISSLHSEPLDTPIEPPSVPAKKPTRKKGVVSDEGVPVW